MARGKAKAKAKPNKAPGRPLWRGHLKLSLVSCPVAIYNAITASEDIRLNMLNPETGNRIRMKTVDAETGEEVERGDTVKGYEFQKDKYVTLSNEELDELKIESSTIMDIEQFVPRDALDARYYDHFYYVIPDGEAGEEAYAVIREAMNKSNTFAITRAVISRKERVIALRPCTKGLMGYGLREETDIRDTDAFFDDIENASVDKDMLSIAMQLVEKKTAEFDPTRFEDRYEARLRQLIEAKTKGVELEDEPQVEEPNVVNLMDALQRSLRGEKLERKPRADDNEGERESATVHNLKPKAKAKAQTAKKPATKKATKTKKRA